MEVSSKLYLLETPDIDFQDMHNFNDFLKANKKIPGGWGIK